MPDNSAYRRRTRSVGGERIPENRVKEIGPAMPAVNVSSAKVSTAGTGDPKQLAPKKDPKKKS